MQGEPRYQLTQPHDPLNTCPFFIDLPAACNDHQSEQQQIGRTSDEEQLPPLLTNEHPSPQDLPQYSNSTSSDGSNSKDEQSSVDANRRNATSQTKKSSRCCQCDGDCSCCGDCGGCDDCGSCDCDGCGDCGSCDCGDCTIS